jgi:succinyl-diaminopimelate desuccinylase
VSLDSGSLYPSPMQERLLAEKLIGYDSSTPEGVRLCAGFIKGWLEARDIPTEQITVRDLPIVIAGVGPVDAPTVIFHGHVDVVPGRDGQFEATVEGDRLIGRGAYDMKGAAAAMMLALADLRDQDEVRVVLAFVPDEETEEEFDRGTEVLVDAGYTADFAITGEPTNMLIGVAAKGVLAVRIEVSGRAAHSSTPWEGDNAIIKAIAVFRGIESLPFSLQSSELFDRPSINLGRILGGDALNKVPDTCVIDVDIRYLPDQDPEAILSQIAAIPDTNVVSTFRWPPVEVDPHSPLVRALGDAARPNHADEVRGVGRDGASDAVAFIRAGTPAVEFGPVGSGHHGPEEWVSISSLAAYRQTLCDFALSVPEAVRGGQG